MPDLIAYVSSVALGETDGYRVSGIALVSLKAPDIPWATADIPWRATPADVNAAIRDAAVAAAAREGFPVGPLDSTVVIGSGATVAVGVV